VAELVDALDLGSSTARFGGSSPFVRTIPYDLLQYKMSNVLIISAQANPIETQVMLDSVVGLMQSKNHTFEVISVPTAKELPVALNMVSEFFGFDAIICLGVIEDAPHERTKYHYKELLSALYDYSTYFGIIVGVSVLFKDEAHLDLDYVASYAASIATSALGMIATVSQIHAIEAGKNVSSKRHN